MANSWRTSLVGGVPAWGDLLEAGGGIPPTIETTSLADGVAGVPYSATITVSGPGAIVLSVVGGALPAWAAIDGMEITGDVARPGYDEFVLQASSEAGADTQALSILVPNEMSGGGEITEDSLNGSRILTPTPATYTVTGGTVQLQFSPGATTYTLDPETGTFTVTGNPVAFELQERPTPQWQVVISVQSPNWTITDT